MRARRMLAAVAVAVAGFGLGACAQENPSVAAYVGKTAYTRTEVDRVFDGGPEEQAQANPGPLREFIVSMLVISEVAERHAADSDKEIEPIDADQVAQGNGLPADNPFVQLQARYAAAVEFLQSEAKAAEPDDELRRELFGQLEAKGVLRPGTSFDQVRRAIDSEELRHLVGVRHLIAELVERYDVVVNPAYAPLVLQAPRVPIANGQVQVDLAIPVSIEGEGFVTDVTTTQAPAQQAPPA